MSSIYNKDYIILILIFKNLGMFLNYNMHNLFVLNIKHLDDLYYK